METARLVAWCVLALISLGIVAHAASAYSGFPTPQYPGNMYGVQSTYYGGPWGERMVYGAYGYFPTAYGYAPYGYRTYGSFYTPEDLRSGRLRMVRSGW